jgi:hypothetical protein
MGAINRYMMTEAMKGQISFYILLSIGDPQADQPSRKLKVNARKLVNEQGEKIWFLWHILLKAESNPNNLTSNSVRVC